MKATVVQDHELLPGGIQVGDEVEIVGFVEHGHQTWAVILGDEGHFEEIPTWALRGAPKAPA